MDGSRKVYEVTTAANMMSNQVSKQTKLNRRRKYYSRKNVGQALVYIDIAKVLLAVCVMWLTAAGPLGTYIHHWVRRHAFNKFHLIQPVYMPTNPNRKHEIEYVMKKNAALFKHYKRIDSQHLSDIFKAFKPHKINIIANADIFFDDTIKMAKSLPQKHVYALSRHDNSNGKLFKRPDSQDTWIFHGHIQNSMLLSALYNINLTLGKPGIDNRLAYELLQAGYQVSNPSKSITSWHVHGTNLREYSHLDVVPPPYAIVYPMTLEDVLAEGDFHATRIEIFPHGFSLEQVRRIIAYQDDDD
ncbi:hypothetical protein PSENEW3n2_00000848 [Picochlorum sp. SENEW3]|nr:hypothetical protein PSENEW3n2_00000848 [Picochlorum sp. SENEW3]WPT15770.1 hypothetical protein PSENEW3_00000848 [Picochlorum sp. SENEW3]